MKSVDQLVTANCVLSVCQAGSVKRGCQLRRLPLSDSQVPVRGRDEASDERLAGGADDTGRGGRRRQTDATEDAACL